MNNDESNNEEEVKKDGTNPLQQGLEKAGNKAVDDMKKEAAKNAAKKAAEGAAKKAAAKGAMTAAAGPVLFWGAIIILCIIIIIGIIMFFVTMPGMAMQRLKKMFNSLGNYVAAFFGADTNLQIDSEQIFGTLDYIEDMGYDLKGFGFLTDYYTNSSDSGEIKKALADEYKNNYEIDEEAGVIRNEDGDIILAKSDFIFTYIASDNYSYTLKNTNLVTQGQDSSIWGKIAGGLTALYYKFYNFFFYRLNDLLGITQAAQDAWGKGLINIYYQGNQIGKKDRPYGGGLFNFDKVEIDLDTKELVLKKGDWDDWLVSKPEVRYSLDGWTGCYSMPLEFLLSIHIATMMPDLAYDMATGFATNVNIILNPINNNTEYQPYIADVRNHWYRDTYFAIDVSEFEKEKINIVDYDYDYQATYAERWSLYKTFDDDDLESSYKEYAKENYGEFKLYVLNSEGEYCTSSDISEYNSSKIIEDIDGDYIYLGSRDEANDEKIFVSKKSVPIDLKDDTVFEDYKWNKIGNMWTAYIEVDDWDGKIKQTGEGFRAETNPQIKKMFLENTYFRYDGGGRTAEIITALRKTIKEKYLGKSTSEYGALNALTTSGMKEVRGFKVPNTYDFTKESAFEKTYTTSELGLGDEYKTITIDSNGNEVKKDTEFKLSDYTGQVSLNQDSLNAFNMLENIHTLDADYIYRDFKELIVELGYFTKEELTDEVPKLLAWPIPETPSLNYPERSIDKRENEYGTMIHSNGDVQASKVYSDTRILENLPELIGIKSPDLTMNGYATRILGLEREDGTRLKTPGDMFIVRTEASDYKINATNDQIAEQAKLSWLKMGEVSDGAQYSVGGSEFAETFGESLEDSTKRNVNDAVFVAWVLKDLGIDVDTIINREIDVDGDGHKDVDDKGEKLKGDWTKSHDMARLCVEDLGAEIIFNYRELRPGDIMAYVYNESLEKYSTLGDTIEYVDVLGEQQLDGSYLRYGGGVLPDAGATKAKDSIDEDTFNQLPLCFGMRISDDGYAGYKGNEMVVSPVTGILLEYGTYNSSNKDSITGEEYRTNVDLKYGPVMKNADEKYEQYSGETVSDKVGYAKIMVLDKDYYQVLESNTSNRWKDSNSLVTENGKFRDELIDDEDFTAVDKILGKRNGYGLDVSKRWSKEEQSVYAYKEFAESYENAGIAGHIIYIDGFACEEPDEEFNDITKDIPQGKELTMESFKVTGKDLATKYIPDEVYEMASTKANHKHKAESMIKDVAYNSIYLDNIVSSKISEKSLIFIKEGTILGRTLTDKELLEKSNYRNKKYGTYEQNREVVLQTKEDGNERIIGNYLRLIMRDQDKTPVEDIEDYYKLGAKEEYDWFSILLWGPFESGGVDNPLEGPESIDTCTPGELAVGIAQWTDLLNHYQRRQGNGINAVLRRCVKDDYDLCWPLEEQIMGCVERWGKCTGDNFTAHPEKNKHYLTNQYEGGGYWDGQYPGYKGEFDRFIRVSPQKDLYGYGKSIFNALGIEIDVEPEELKFIHCRWEDRGVYHEVMERIRKSDLQKALTKVCNMDREKFFRLQRQLAKEAFLDPILVQHPWVMDRPLCVQGILLHLLLGNGDEHMPWLTSDMTNEDILEAARSKIASRKSTASDPTNDPTSGRAWSEPEIAYNILNGTLNKYQNELWVRTAVNKVLEDAGVDFRGQ